MDPRRRQVTWTDNAISGLDANISFVAQESSDNASRLLDRILDAADSLRFLAERGPVVAEYDDPDVRQLLVDSFRLLYHVGDTDVHVLGVLHQRQDLRRWRNRKADPDPV
jgi:plasmid stabilization system protein ParE